MKAEDKKRSPSSNTKVPCGKTMGHGECCTKGHECDQCLEIAGLREVLKIKELEKIELKEGEILVIKLANKSFNHQVAQRVHKMMRTLIPQRKMLVVPEDVHFLKIKEEDVTKEVQQKYSEEGSS